MISDPTADAPRTHAVSDRTERAEERGVRTVAIFEACKGLLVLLLGVGLGRWIHRNAERVAVDILRGFHLNPAHHYPHVFVLYAERLGSIRFALLAAGAAAYATVRFVEAYGLWHLRPWARWFGVAAGALYIPLELYEIAKHVSAGRIAVLVVNVAIVVFLLVAKAAFQPRAPVA